MVVEIIAIVHCESLTTLFQLGLMTTQIIAGQIVTNTPSAIASFQKTISVVLCIEDYL